MESTPGIKAQVIRVMVSVSRDPSILEERAGRKPIQEKELFPLERAGKELIQEKDFGAKLNSTGRGLHLRRRR